MKKEKKDNKKEQNKNITICFMTLVLIITLTIISNYSITLKTELENCNNSKEITDLNETVNTNEEESNQQELTYDCSFTRTYNIVNTLDGYRSEVLEISYVVIDAFQAHEAYTHVIPTKLKDGLKNNKTYEFTYTIKGNGNINDMQDIYNKIVSTTVYEEDKEHAYNEPKLKVTLNIKETDKLGMAQLQEPICKGK